MNRIAIYIRKSSESEDRQVLSIESQVKELTSFAKKMGWRIANVYTESKSAKAPGREIFNSMYNEIQKGNIQELLCWKLDRLARNPVDGGALIWAMEENKLLHIHTPQRSFNNTGNDKFWLQLEFGMAKKYVDDLSDNVKRGLKTRAENGWYPFQAPLGYLNDSVKKTIVKDPDRFQLVKKMWELLLAGVYTPNKIVGIANDEWGLRTKPFKSGGNFPVSRSYVYSIFTNPFYYGVFRYNGNIFKGNHPPMITEEQFERAQTILKCDYTTRPKQYEFAYTGLIKCGECGASITAEHKTNRYGYKYIYYHCTRRKKDITCSQRCVEEKALEKQVVDFLGEISIEEDTLNLVLEILAKQKDSVQSEQKVILGSIKKQLTESERNLSELLNIKLRGLLSDDEFSDKKNELEGQIRRYQSRLEKAKLNSDGSINKTIKAFEYASKVKSVFENGAVGDRKAVLHYVGSNLTLYNKKLSIMAVKPFRYMQSPVGVAMSKNTMFEPRYFGSYNTQTATKSDGFCAILAVVNSVRTYFSTN